MTQIQFQIVDVQIVSSQPVAFWPQRLARFFRSIFIFPPGRIDAMGFLMRLG